MTYRPNAPLRTAALLLTLLAVTGCQGLIPGAQRDPPRLYELTPKSTFPDDLPRIDQQLIIETPVSSAGLASARIAIKLQPTTLDYYARSEWTDTAPNLVQTLLIESFDNTDKIIAVGREGSGLRSDFVLKIELREFQAEMYESTTPEVHVRLNTKLVLMPQREIVDGGRFEAKVPAKSDSLEDVVLAFDDSLGKVMKGVVIWTMQKLDERSGPRRPRLPPRGRPLRPR